MRVRPSGKKPMPEIDVVLAGRSLPLASCQASRPQDKTGFFAVAADAKPGKQTVAVRYRWRRRWCKADVSFHVMPRDFPVERLTVEPKLAVPNEADQKRIAEESRETNAIYASPERGLVAGDGFAKPVNSRATSVFGLKRVYNKQTESLHSGVDLRAGETTPVRAAAAGIVRLSKPLFFAGNAVILDHGMGLFTSYSHLSRADVKPGDRVRKGQVLGLAGKTGRVTGPHLHWGMKVQGVSIDPLTFEPIFGHACLPPAAPTAKSRRRQ